jgi:hypothetical protein
MKRYLNFIFLFILAISNSNSFAQSTVMLEQIQVYSTLNPNAKYWQLPDDISGIQKALDSGIFKESNLTRLTSFSTIKKTLTKQSQVGKITLNWEESRNIPFHAYLEIYELDPETTYENKLVTVSESKKDSIQSVWAIVVGIFNQQHQRIFQKTLLLGMMPIASLGLGYPSNWAATSPNTLYQAINKGIQFISKDIDNMEFMEATVPIAYATDNYWMPLTHNQPRTMLDTSKPFISYASSTGLQLLRIPNARLTKIDLKNKDNSYPYKDIINTIKKIRTSINSKEYYQVIQPLRDVQANKDYTLNGIIEFNTNYNNAGDFMQASALQFLPEISNSIYDGKDSIGYFKVSYGVVEKDKFFYPEKIYNGYDSTKQYEIKDKISGLPIMHSAVVSGKAYGQEFSIQFDNNEALKTILINKKMTTVIEGIKKPRQMVNLAKENNSHLNNLLILMAYGELFQSPK